MNVLQLTLSFHSGGRRRAITSLADQLRKRGVSCSLGCIDALGCNRDELECAFKSIELFCRRSAFDWRAVRHLSDFCQRSKIDIIHAHDAASQYLGALFRATKPRHKLLMTFHRSLGFESATIRDRGRNAFANLLTAAVVVGSTERRRHFLRENFIRRDKVIRIPFGTDTWRFRRDLTAAHSIRSGLGINGETIVIGAVGHFGPEKGIDVVIRGFQRLSIRELSQPVVLVVLGSGLESQERALRELAAEVPTARIVFAGFQSDVHSWMNAFDLFVHAPRLEAFGLVLLEAMASGLPVVATRVGGIPDIVWDGHTGLLVPVDSPDQLADAIQHLISEPKIRGEMAAAGEKRAVTEFTAERYADRYLELYESLLHGRRPLGVDQLNGSMS